MKTIILKEKGQSVTGTLLSVITDHNTRLIDQSMTILIKNEVYQLYVPKHEIPGLASLINTGVYKITISGYEDTPLGKRKLISVTKK